MEELETLICPYCGRECLNQRSWRGHTARCPDNPFRDTSRMGGCRRGVKKNFIPWNKGLTKESSDAIRIKAEALKKKYADGILIGPQKGKPHDAKVKEKISNSMKGNQNANHRGDRQTRYRNIRMDSRWEAAVAHHLDKIGAKWVYNEMGYRLSDGRYYYPDFFLYKKDGTFSHLIEVKGYFRENNKLKFAQFREEYPDVQIRLWSKEKLKRLELIDSSGRICLPFPSGDCKSLV